MNERFVGKAAGLAAMGSVGIFVGATLLVVCFTLLKNWLKMEQPLLAVNTEEL